MIGPRASTFRSHSWRPLPVKRPMATLVAVLVLLAAPIITLMPAAETQAASYFGCDVQAIPPTIENEEVVANAAVECQVSWPDREIRTELWQLASGGGWAPIEDSITTWEGSDRVLPLHYPDSTGINCAIPDDSTRDFQSRIFIDDGAGHVAVVVSDRMRLNRDCLAAAGVEAPTNRVGAEGSGGVTCGIFPSRPVNRGGQIRASAFFDCDSAGIYEVRYFRVRLVREQSGLDRVLRNRAFADTSGLARGFTLIAACNDRSGSGRYYTWAREVAEDARGDQVSGSAQSTSVNLDARCR